MSDELKALVEDLAHLRRLSLYDYLTVMPELEEMANCVQDPIWHAEGNVLLHTQMVMDAAHAEIESASRLSLGLRQTIYLAAFLHDVGKPLTTSTSEAGRVISPGHSVAGMPLARSILYRLGTPFEVREQTLMLIFHHMTAYRLVGRIQPELVVDGVNVEQQKYWRLSTDVNMQALYHVTRADWIGREGTNIERTLAQINTFRKRSIFYRIWEKGFEGVLSESDLYKITTDPKEQARIKHEMLLLSLNGQLQRREEALEFIKTHPQIASPTTAHFYLTVGVPGCGKSTWLAENLKGARIISSDEKRMELFGDVSWQGDNTRVFDECYSDIDNALSRGEIVALDATNIKTNQRIDFLDLARRHHAHTKIVYFDLPLEVALERNLKRDRRVPEEAIVRYFHELIAPRRTEAQELIAITAPASPAWK
jgi:predicted kinase